jgi:hypothetical protein
VLLLLGGLPSMVGVSMEVSMRNLSIRSHEDNTLSCNLYFVFYSLLMKGRVPTSFSKKKMKQWPVVAQLESACTVVEITSNIKMNLIVSCSLLQPNVLIGNGKQSSS